MGYQSFSSSVIARTFDSPFHLDRDLTGNIPYRTLHNARMIYRSVDRWTFLPGSAGVSPATAYSYRRRRLSNAAAAGTAALPGRKSVILLFLVHSSNAVESGSRRVFKTASPDGTCVRGSKSGTRICLKRLFTFLILQFYRQARGPGRRPVLDDTGQVTGQE